MSRRRGQEPIRKIQFSRGSYVITLPIGEVRQLGWQEGQKVVVKRKGRGFTIVDWTKKSQ
ncbi:MAG: hypothetical protein V1684_00195 [bacterium]